MFAAEAKELIDKIGDKDLIASENLNRKLDLLTLVKVSHGKYWPVQKYNIMHQSLPELVGEEEEEVDYSKDCTVKDFVENFTTSLTLSGSGGVGGIETVVGEVEVNASADTVDGLAHPYSMKIKTANLKTLRTKFNGRTISQDSMDMLGLKEKDKLTFIYQTVYNTCPVKLIRKCTTAGSFIASCIKMLSLNVKGKRTEDTSFIVPEKSTFAYGLVELKSEDGKLKISCDHWTKKSALEVLLGDSMNSGTLQQVKQELVIKAGLLQPLKGLPEVTCRDLWKSLSKLLEDRNDLSLLEQKLDQCSKGEYERPQSQAVSSFMDLLDVSNVSTAVKNAVHLLVSALDTLPEEAAPLLTSCSPDALTVLNQLVDGLKEDGQAKLPESLPVPLQEGGELRWAAELICSTNQTLAELSEDWDRPELPLEVLLEVLCLAVQGLSLMQPRTNS